MKKQLLPQTKNTISIIKYSSNTFFFTISVSTAKISHGGVWSIGGQFPNNSIDN